MSFAPHEFVIEVDDPVLAMKIENIINNKIGPNDPVHLKGKVVRGRVAYNEEYAFHLDPKSIELISHTIEVCSATAFLVEEHLDRVGVPVDEFLKDGEWCPWDARFVREIKYPFPNPSK
ncbi:hypothetical protein [Dyella nitratireducens]|uniref:BP74-related protein n=1 Tax=Dyella nitratireducens TaxID=1849580 RepID=UPI003C2D66B5